jgi:GNAT superfamily N-acetyltransferase
MRVYELDTLPPPLRPQLAAFGVSDGDPPQDVSLLRRLRRLRYPASEYWGVYAVEGGQVLSRVETLHLTFSGRTGRQSVVGISDVLTRPAGVGRGFARRLLEEVHVRERERGRKWSFLWTHRTWGAHGLYLKLGYRDVYSPPHALRKVRRGTRTAPPSGYRWSVARRPDPGRSQRILSEATRSRLGFVPRNDSLDSIRLLLGWRKPENLRILSFHSDDVGYAYLGDDGGWYLTANEVVVTSPEHREAMIRSLEGLAAGRWLTLQLTSFVRDAEVLLRERKYAVLPASHVVMMAKPLGPTGTIGEDLRTVAEDPAFSNHRGDMF